MKKLLIALVVAIGLLVVPAVPAQAGTCIAILCGTVQNRSDSKTGILVTNQWPQDSSSASWQRLAPGVKSTFKDTDGFYIPSGYKAYDKAWGTFSAGWHKITDAQHMLLYVYRA